MSDGMSIWRMPDNPTTYVVDLPTRQSDDLIKTLIGSYSIIDKEAKMSDALYFAIKNYLLNDNRDLLVEVIRQFEEHRGIESPED